MANSPDFMRETQVGDKDVTAVGNHCVRARNMSITSMVSITVFSLLTVSCEARVGGVSKGQQD